MRIILAIAFGFAVASAGSACGKKKPAQTPANAAPAEPASTDMKEKGAPADKDDKRSTHSADPCEGGE